MRNGRADGARTRRQDQAAGAVDLVVDSLGDDRPLRHAEALDLNMKLEFERNHERYQFMEVGRTGLRRLPRGAAELGISCSGRYQAPFPRRARCAWPVFQHPGGHRLARHHDPAASAWWAGAWAAASGPKRRCSASRLSPHPRHWWRGAARQPAGSTTATDTVLAVTEMLRREGGGQVRRFFGGACAVVTDRFALANMAPEVRPPWASSRSGHHRLHALHRPRRAAGAAGQGATPAHLWPTRRAPAPEQTRPGPVDGAGPRPARPDSPAPSARVDQPTSRHAP